MQISFQLDCITKAMAEQYLKCFDWTVLNLLRAANWQIVENTFHSLGVIWPLKLNQAKCLILPVAQYA
jgi:hypothetical protein